MSKNPARAIARLGSASDPTEDPLDALFAPVELDLASARGQAGTINDTARRLDEFGFDGGALLAPAIELLAKANAHREVLLKYRSDVRQRIHDARKAFAEGKATLEDLDALAGQWDRIRDSSSTMSRSLNAAVAITLQDSERVFRETVTNTVFPALAKEAAKAAQEAAEAAKALPATVRTREDARRAGRGAAGVWADLGNLIDRFSDLETFRYDLGSRGLLPRWDFGHAYVGKLVTNVRAAMPLWLKYEHPEKLPQWFRNTDVLAIELRLPTAVAAGAVPGMYSAEDAIGRFVTWRSGVEEVIEKRRDGHAAAIDAVLNLPGVQDMYADQVGTRSADVASTDNGVPVWQASPSAGGQ